MTETVMLISLWQANGLVLEHAIAYLFESSYHPDTWLLSIRIWNITNKGYTHTHTHTERERERGRERKRKRKRKRFLSPSTRKTNGGEKAYERRLWGRARSEAHLRVYDFKGSERNQWDFGLLAIAALKKLSSSCIKKTVVPLVLDFIGDTNDSTMR